MFAPPGSALHRLPCAQKPGNTPPVSRSTLLHATTLHRRAVVNFWRLWVGPSAYQRVTAPGHRVLASTCLALVCAAGIPGCNSFRGLAQCRSVTSTVNNVLEQARDLHEEEPTPERYLEITKLLAGLQTTLTGLTVADSDLKQAVDDYVKQLQRSGRDSEAYAHMLEQLAKAKTSNDAAATTLAANELAKIRLRASKALESAKPLAKRFREACKK